MIVQTPRRLTAADFEALPDTRHPVQLIEGALIEIPPPTSEHQRLVVQLVLLLSRLRSDGQVFISPVAVYLDDQNVVEPDVLWLAPESQCRTAPKRLEGAPELVIEVLSPATARHDKTVKFLLYEKHGVREYWLINPDQRQAEIWTRHGDEFALHGTFDAQNTFTSPVRLL